MNDTIYVGNIPKDYKYARFNSNYIDLFKQPNLEGVLDYYRIYMYNNLFEYEHMSTTFSQMNSTTAKLVNVTDDFRYRRDFPSICFVALLNILIILVIVNLITSVFKKGGLLSGLI